MKKVCEAYRPCLSEPRYISDEYQKEKKNRKDRRLI